MTKQFNKMFEEHQSKFNSNLKKYESSHNLNLPRTNSAKPNSSLRQTSE